MENYHYICRYCKKEFIPKRRKVQKFCSTSCRVRSHQLSQKFNKPAKLNAEKTKIDQVSAAGVVNAALGTTAADLVKNLLTPEQSKSATKADLRRLEELLQRYHKVENIKSLSDGRAPYFDMQMKRIVYR
ncbi:hypothetical protein G3567_11875 [Psychroflexus sp. YR1-1]|uniref:Uncharacterized protein n=1 Tax=Psychroflexus aurantiacus TaxID=2709310 RepID=A0A6B3R2T9_9FLAO|nr:hypothetical protein [Psychroflexus aurantiacus]NEV94843.1 hypothetical protein [Psychroflexus aurantiacus]